MGLELSTKEKTEKGKFLPLDWSIKIKTRNISKFHVCFIEAFEYVLSLHCLQNITPVLCFIPLSLGEDNISFT